jgi:hypothetical protein
MRRIIVLCFALLTLAGCQGSTSMVNPFAPYGPSQIPPPPTGTAGRPDPYYRRAAVDAGTNQTSQSVTLPPLRTFTSADAAAPTAVADRRAGLDAGANLGPANAAPTDSLDWRSPTSVPSSPAGSSFSPTVSTPRPRFPSSEVVPASGYANVAPPQLDPRMAQAASQIPPQYYQAGQYAGQQYAGQQPYGGQPHVAPSSGFAQPSTPGFPAAPAGGWSSTSSASSTVGSGVAPPSSGYNAWSGR